MQAVAAIAALLESLCGLVLDGEGAFNNRHDVLFLTALLIPSVALACVTALVAASGLRRQRVSTGQLLLLQVLWIGWSQTYGQGVYSDPINAGTIGLAAGIAVLIASAIDQVTRLRR